jgi:phosphoribosyl 1,2-cyclic phosphodiesterase
MDAEQFIVRFWGTRGSYPVPGPHTVRYGGNTTCVEVQVGKNTLIIDAGTGIINLGYDLLRRARENGNHPITATLLLTHMHHDHTQGFPFFLPAYAGTSKLHILGPRTFDEELEETLNHAVLPPNFPVSLHEMPSLKVVRSLHETEMILLDPEPGSLHIHNIYHSHIVRSPNMVCINIHRSQAHPRDGVHIYRIEWGNKSVVFASDTEGYVGTDQRLVNFAHNTDLLIHDAQYTQKDYIASKQGWGHSTPQMACEVAQSCGARRLVFTHHEPRYNDEAIAAMEQEAQRCFPEAIAAYEGLEIIL